MNREHRLLTLALIIFLLSGAAIGLSQTPPGPNTIQHGEGANYPTVTSQYGYFYGTPPVNITDSLFGDFGTLDVTTSGDIIGGTLSTVGSVSGTTYLIGATDVTDVLEYPVQPASYIIWTDGSTYYAKNGITGAIDYSGASFPTVINSAITASTTGEIHIGKGTFAANSQVLVRDKEGLRITGEGRATIIDVGSNGITVFNFSSSTATHRGYNSLSNLKLLAASRPVGSLGIYLDSQNHFVLNDVFVQSFETGLHVGLGDSFYIYSNNFCGYFCGVGAYFEGKVSSSTFVNLCFQECIGNGLTTGSSSPGVSLILPIMEDCGNDGMNIGIYSGLLITGGYIVGNGNDGLAISGEGAYYTKGVEISGGYYSSSGGSNIRLDRVTGVNIQGIYSKSSTVAGVEISGLASNITLTSNYLEDTTPISDAGATAVRYCNNHGYTGLGDIRVSGTNIQTYNGTAWVTIGSW